MVYLDIYYLEVVTMNELDELRQQALAEKEAKKNKTRELYLYAKANGFDSYEAKILCQTSKEKIDRIIKLK